MDIDVQSDSRITKECVNVNIHINGQPQTAVSYCGVPLCIGSAFGLQVRSKSNQGGGEDHSAGTEQLLTAPSAWRTQRCCTQVREAQGEGGEDVDDDEDLGQEGLPSLFRSKSNLERIDGASKALSQKAVERIIQQASSSLAAILNLAILRRFHLLF